MERQQGRSRLILILIAVFFLFSAGFLASLGFRPYPLSWLVKTIPIACLALFALTRLSGPARWAMASGFSFSAVGDILLELPAPGLFQAGMGAFILAHIAYITWFVRHPRLTPGRGLAMAGMVAFTLGIAFFLYPKLGEMVLPIMVYLLVILAMGIAACLGRVNNLWVMGGAALFILSDSLIAFNMFAGPLPNSSFWVMLTYYLAQALLAIGVSLSQKRG